MRWMKAWLNLGLFFLDSTRRAPRSRERSFFVSKVPFLPVPAASTRSTRCCAILPWSGSSAASTPANGNKRARISVWMWNPDSRNRAQLNLP